MNRIVTLTALLLTACSPVYLDAAQNDDPRQARTVGTVRVVSWNIETVGSVGTDQHDAALQILDRLDADVVALQEVDWEVDLDDLDAFAEAAGYDYIVTGGPVDWGSHTQAILSRFPVLHSELASAASLSGDPDANDLTRSIPVVTLDVWGQELIVASSHFKAADDIDDQFRRTIDAHRGVQALGTFDPSTDLVVFAGDLNDDILDPTNSPSWWTYAPTFLPSSYELGADMEALLASGGFANNTFAPFEDAGLTVLDAYQLYGGDVTRHVSGRRLDYLVVSEPLVAEARTEVYDTYDEGRGGGLPKPGPVPTYWSSDAADHFPVFVDLVLPEVVALTVDDLQAGDLAITELMPDPTDCTDATGEWVEVRNDTNRLIDLTGLDLCDASNCSQLDGVGLLAPDEVAVLARSATACGVPTVHGTFTRTLNNGGDTIALEAHGLVVDEVTYLDSDPGISVGTPGGDCEGTEGGTPGFVARCGEPVVWSLEDVPDGLLRLSEVMPNPVCGDTWSEWFEVVNTSVDASVDLTGLLIEDGARLEALGTSKVLEPGDRALFARSTGACDLPYVDATFDLALNNDGDRLELLRPGGGRLDLIVFPATGSGYVWNLESDDSYCISDEPTPGAANGACL